MWVPLTARPALGLRHCLSAWSVVGGDSRLVPCWWLTNGAWSVAVSLCRAQDPRPPFTESLPRAGFSLCFLALDCECTRASSIPTQLCAFSPWVHSGDTRGSAHICPVWVFMPCLLWGLTVVLLVAPPPPAAAQGVSRASTGSSVGFPPIHGLTVLRVTWRP